MSRKSIGLALFIVGILISAVSLSADYIGLGQNNFIGYEQQTGIAIGLVIALVGLVLYILRKKK